MANWDGSCAGIEGGENIKFDTLITDKEEGARIRETQMVVDDEGMSSSNNYSAPRPVQQQQQRRHVDTSTPPFANVESVQPNSPAESADLKIGDQIVRFGNVSRVDDFKTIGTIVQDAADRNSAIKILVVRDRSRNVRVELELRPREWAGRGNSGAYITPIIT